MVARVVTFDGTRVNDADSATNWANLGGGGPAPASEPQLRYQYSGTGSVGAVNRKITSTTARQGVQYDPGAGAIDMTAAAFPLAFLKGYVSDFGDLNATYGCEFRIGSGNAAYYDYNVAGSGANRAPYSNGYPAQGGYLLAAINPNIAAWREGTTGSPVLTTVDYYAFAAQFIAGGTKDVNLAMDAIDVGRGLILVSGTGADPDGNFIDFLEVDQDTIANRWGVVNGTDPVMNARGMLQIGNSGGTETDFSDDFSTVIFPDGYHGPGNVGVRVEMQNASSVINIANTLIGLGSATTSDTRPDLTVVGTTGACTISCLATNFRNIILTSIVDVINADLEFADLTQAAADISASTLRPNSASGVAAINDATFGVSSGIRDVEFIQSGVGHAIEITTPGTYNFQDIVFTGFGGTPGTNSTPSSGANDAAIYNNSGGAVTINVNGSGNQPSVRNAASSTTTVAQTVTVTIKCVDAVTGSAIQGVAVNLGTTGVGSNDLISFAVTDVNGEVSTSYGGSTPQAVNGYAAKGTAVPTYRRVSITGTITSSGLTQTVPMNSDD